MQKDLHYYGIATLARAVGYSIDDALTIAYASQYTDNSTESGLIKIGDLFFDPVRTAHIGLQCYDWSVQKRIYLPFHFLPPKSIVAPKDSFITEGESVLMQGLLERADADTHPVRRLCRIGIALHTLADCHSHQGFSGRRHWENDVERIKHYKNGKWAKLLFENIFFDLAPRIGHAEAGIFPDLPFLKWKYSIKAASGYKEVKRDNPTIFLTAMKKIYSALRNTNNEYERLITWKDLEPKLRRLIADNEQNVDKRCNKWISTFKNLFPSTNITYNPKKWRNEALRPQQEQQTDWDTFSESDFKRLSFELHDDFFESKWFHFHKAALFQRHFVLENLI
jgi:hypothetical protein